MLGKKIKIIVLTLVMIISPISVMQSTKATTRDSIVIDNYDGNTAIPPSVNKGSITIKLSDIKSNVSKEGVEFSLSKIADGKDGVYKVKEEYSNVKVDLSNIKTASDLELAAGLFKESAKTDKLIKTNFNGECSINNLDIGVYLVYAKNIADYDNITPFLISIPSWDENKKSMSYNIQVIPKHTKIIEKEKSKIPDTGYNNKTFMYFTIGSILLVGSGILFFGMRKKVNK